MSGSVNKVILVGNLGKDPEIRAMQDGSKIAQFSIATSESWNDKQSGERRDRTEWHRIVIYNDKLSEIAEKFLRKGSKVYVEGQLQTRKWTDQSGQERYTTEVALQRFRGELTMLDSKRDGSNNYSNDEYNQDSNAASYSGSSIGGAGSAAAVKQAAPDFAADLDDDIPF